MRKREREAAKLVREEYIKAMLRRHRRHNASRWEPDELDASTRELRRSMMRERDPGSLLERGAAGTIATYGWAPVVEHGTTIYRNRATNETRTEPPEHWTEAQTRGAVKQEAELEAILEEEERRAADDEI